MEEKENENKFEKFETWSDVEQAYLAGEISPCSDVEDFMELLEFCKRNI